MASYKDFLQLDSWGFISASTGPLCRIITPIPVFPFGIDTVTCRAYSKPHSLSSSRLFATLSQEKSNVSRRSPLVLCCCSSVLGFGGRYLWSNLDSIIRAAVEKYGTAATQTAVKLDSVKLSIASGEGGMLGGLSIANPEGFRLPLRSKRFYLDSVSVKVRITASIRGTGPIVIREITIVKPQVNYELTNGGDSNLQTIQRNAMAYANKMNSGKATPGQAEAEKDKTPGRKMVINDSLCARRPDRHQLATAAGQKT